MATLIVVESSGRSRRRCDATCHGARGPRCACICGGRYHGKGNTPGALDQTRAQLERALLEAAGQAGLEDLLHA